MNWIVIFLRGVAMGAADVVPGVSGGTIAFITGIYQRLINAIKSFDANLIKLLKNRHFSKAWAHVDGSFLLTLGMGIVVSLITLAKAIKFLLTNYPLFIWSFFFGLIIASIFFLYKEIKKWDLFTIISLSIGTAIAYYITIAAPTQTTEARWFIFISGMIAISAMILPGISGSFLLLLMGKYTFILGTISSLVNHLKTFDIEGIIADGTIGVIFGLGCLTGLLSFSRLIAWILKHYWNITIALLTGFMIGSLNKVWPWKRIIETYVDRHGVEKTLIEQSILPGSYQQLVGDAHLTICLMLMLFGAGLVFALTKLADKNNQSN